MKNKNPNDEVNAKILQVLDEWENDIDASNKALETFDIIWEEESWSWGIENNNPYKN